jgi:hypothetical protein
MLVSLARYNQMKSGRLLDLAVLYKYQTKLISCSASKMMKAYFVFETVQCPVHDYQQALTL